MTKLINIDGVYYFVKNGSYPMPLRGRKKGPNAHTTQTVTIEAWATRDGYLDSNHVTATFLIHN